jgi:peptidoglycan/LPS O-acetylase OafA/YrhL
MISDFEKKRDNNYPLLRLCFALAVLFGHSFPITGNGSDPISSMLLPYTWIGSIAVDGFFAISGFLVTASYLSRGPINYAASRILRLYPAIILYSFVAILIIGPLSINVPLSTYFAANPWNNLLNAPLWKWQYNLPYAFSANTFSGATNGSTWTLPVELRCYILVFVLGYFRVFESRARANIALGGMLFAVYWNNGTLFLGCEDRSASPLAHFLLGALARVNHRLIPLNWLLAGLAAIAPFLTTGSACHMQISQVSLVYVIFFIVYRAPYVDLEKLGDLSYGIYIYSWPIQQMVWRQGQSGFVNAALALPIVVLSAYVSWRFVEAPALRLRARLPDGSSQLNREMLTKATSFPRAVLAPFFNYCRGLAERV